MMRLKKLLRKKRRPGRTRLRPPRDQDGQTPGARRLERLFILLAFVVLVATLTQHGVLDRKVLEYDIDSDLIARETWKAEFPFETPNLQATRMAREEAAGNVPDSYRINRERVEDALGKLQEQIDSLRARQGQVEGVVREALLASDSGQNDQAVVWQAVTGLASELKGDPDFEKVGDASLLALWLLPHPECIPPREFASGPPDSRESDDVPRPVVRLLEPEVSAMEFVMADFLNTLAQQGLEYALTYGVLDKGADQAQDAGDGGRRIVIVRDRPDGSQERSKEIPINQVPRRQDAQGILRAGIAETAEAAQAKQLSEDTIDWAKAQEAAYALAKLHITGTLDFDRVATEGAQEAARTAVAPVYKKIEFGEVIQRDGEYWTEQSRSDVKTYWEKQQRGLEPAVSVFEKLLAHTILVGLVLMCLLRAMPLLQPQDTNRARSLNLALLIICMTLILGRIASYFETSGLVVPAAAGAILLAILVNARLAAMTGILMAVLLSIQYQQNWRLLMVSAAMSITGVFSFLVVRRRSDMTAAALKATGVGLLIMVAITLATDSLFSDAAEQRLLLITLNGVACLLLVPGLLSPLERLFGITTDIQLLEYSDLNNEVLSRLAIEVPATYAHSLMLGQLTEAASDAIGANGLLARVCAYYHDIGKLRRPEYFSENQSGANVHDGLSPRLSARAIAAHVTDGVELAREHHLPKPIIDGILEHHGTNLISFFYQEAVAQQKHGDVCADDFRYSGPKPQSRETAILMICDAVESAVRSIKNPNEERVRELVEKIVTGRAADRQFDECDLTLKELDTIGDVVTKRIMTTLHTRIAYPEKTIEKPATNAVAVPGGQE